MRITNTMMQNNSLNNIQTNKTQMNTLDTQLSTQKKISRPSEDPIIAIRALRLRTSLNEVTQYLSKNIPDANSWLDVTEGALNEANDIISDVYNYCVQGSTDTQSLSERQIISDSLQQLREGLYQQGDVDYAGRYVFTGYRTDTSLTFQTDDDLSEADYSITQDFESTDFDYKSVVTGGVDIAAVKSLTGDELGALSSDEVKAKLGDSNDISSTDVHRIRLAYDDIKKDADSVNSVSISYTDASGDTQDFLDDFGYSITETTDTGSVPGEDEILLNTDTGELLFGENAYKDLFSTGKFSVTYEKDSFEKGDCRPEHYFTCTNYAKTAVTYSEDGTVKTTDYATYVRDKDGQDIEYIVNFNQKLKVNTEAADSFSLDIGRDIDEIRNAVDDSIVAEEKLNTLKELKDNPNYSGDEAQANLDRLIDTAQKELDYYNDVLQKTFESGITWMQDHQETVDIAIADVGNRMSRLDLTKERLQDQKTNFTDLKSSNEDIDLEEVVINYSSAELVYQASLTAASKVVRQTLLDFI